MHIGLTNLVVDNDKKREERPVTQIDSKTKLINTRERKNEKSMLNNLLILVMVRGRKL